MGQVLSRDDPDWQSEKVTPVSFFLIIFLHYLFVIIDKRQMVVRSKYRIKIRK